MTVQEACVLQTVKHCSIINPHLLYMYVMAATGQEMVREKFFKLTAVATMYVQSLQDSVLYFITGFNIHVNISYVNDFS